MTEILQSSEVWGTIKPKLPTASESLHAVRDSILPQPTWWYTNVLLCYAINLPQWEGIHKRQSLQGINLTSYSTSKK